jgi:hypothetical protein
VPAWGTGGFQVPITQASQPATATRDWPDLHRMRLERVTMLMDAAVPPRQISADVGEFDANTECSGAPIDGNIERTTVTERLLRRLQRRCRLF